MKKKKKDAKITNTTKEIIGLLLKDIDTKKLVQLSILPGRSKLVFREQFLPDIQTKIEMGCIKVELFN